MDILPLFILHMCYICCYLHFVNRIVVFIIVIMSNLYQDTHRNMKDKVKKTWRTRFITVIKTIPVELISKTGHLIPRSLVTVFRTTVLKLTLSSTFLKLNSSKYLKFSSLAVSVKIHMSRKNEGL